ncbi:MAG: hypothetical protein GXY36_09025 [Chloroflexi bacterium]|nr:hypothetical protein [Chloroflexota bacterium]
MYRRSRLRSSRGHVRLEQRPANLRWMRWAALAVAGVILAWIIVQQVILPAFEDEQATTHNRTWLEYAWAAGPINETAVQQLAERLRDNQIDRVYLEASAWRRDDTLIEGEFTGDFAHALRTAYPELEVLLWLRMSGEQIRQSDLHVLVADLAERAVGEWGLNGVQLNGRTVENDSDSFVDLIRALRTAIGPDALLSVTVPPDRIPTDPEVPIGSTADPGLTWNMSYKQRVGLLLIDEIVIMPHASGLENIEAYEQWVAYQVKSYIEALSELETSVEIVVGLPTYDASPDHDPAIEGVQPAINGVRRSLDEVERAREWVRGVGLYEYKTTDSLEWALYREHWLGIKSD